MKMKKVEIEVPEGKTVEWVNGILMMVDEKPKSIMDRVKSFGDAIEAVGTENPKVVDYFRMLSLGDISKDVIAYMKLRVIAEALNGRDKYNSEKYMYYFPWFEAYESGRGFIYKGAVYVNPDKSISTKGAYYSLRISFRNKELAEYAGKQFIDIWKDFIM